MSSIAENWGGDSEQGGKSRFFHYIVFVYTFRVVTISKLYSSRVCPLSKAELPLIGSFSLCTGVDKKMILSTLALSHAIIINQI